MLISVEMRSVLFPHKVSFSVSNLPARDPIGSAVALRLMDTSIAAGRVVMSCPDYEVVVKVTFGSCDTSFDIGPCSVFRW